MYSMSNKFLGCILLLLFSLVISESSESEGDDGYDLSTQFDEIPPDSNNDDEPVSIEAQRMPMSTTSTSAQRGVKEASDTSISVSLW